ncbi:MAG: hypothetical protein J6B81_03990 [Spirochaetaceae bacterium]|nr:hypothetical protein [Spirochaetaceae bacterium]
MAKKERKIVSASTGKTSTKREKKSTVGLRIGAVLLWVAAIAMEVLAILILFGKISILNSIPTMYQFIGLLVLDLVFVIIGSQLWKKANHINPASEKNKFAFWLWNNMGVVVCVIAFVPFIVLLLMNKDTDKKTKAICTAVAVVALLGGGLASYDFDPLSIEEQTAIIQEFSGDMVYWTQFGKVFHDDVNCPSLNRSDTLVEGTIEQATEDGKYRLCKKCETRTAIAE